MQHCKLSRGAIPFGFIDRWYAHNEANDRRS